MELERNFKVILCGLPGLLNAQFVPLWGGWIPPWSLWAYGGPGIGGPYPDIGIAGMGDYVIDLPQQTSGVSHSGGSYSGRADMSSVDSKDSENKTTETRELKHEVAAFPLSVTDGTQGNMVNISLSDIAKKLAEAPKDGARPKI